MKYKAFIFLIFVAFKLNAQDLIMWKPDSLNRTLKVKKRLMNFKHANDGGYVVDYFDKKGKLLKSETMSELSISAIITVDYFYDSTGKLFASKLTPKGDGVQGSGYVDAFGDKYQSLTTYYEYGANNRIKRKYYLDAGNKQLKYECLYLNNLSVMDHKWFNSKSHLILERIDSLEQGSYIIKADLKRYDSAGNLLSEQISTYNNEFNFTGQLIQTKFIGPECSSTKLYSYYENGLSKEKKGDSCSLNCKFTYKYY